MDTQVSYLVAAIITYLAVIVLLFFAVTARRNAFEFFALALFFALCGAFWIYRYVRARATP